MLVESGGGEEEKKTTSMSVKAMLLQLLSNAADGINFAPADFWKGVASLNVPFRAPALLTRLSISIPIVIREGNAWGLIIRSGLQHQSGCFRL